MEDLNAFPKIFALGQKQIQDIFKDEVEITEKLDGSQFVFGKINGQVRMRSKSCELYFDNPEKMFAQGITYIDSIKNRIPNGVICYCEYLSKPKHNVIKYDSLPENYLSLFAVKDAKDDWCKWDELKEWASHFSIDVIPLIMRGKIENLDLNKIIGRKSALGSTPIEGIVVKNYQRPYMVANQYFPLMAGKYVSEAFKEVHRGVCKKDKTTKGKWQTFKEGYRVEMRWQKSILHLIEKGEIEYSPRDIGKLIKEIQRDITEEEQDNIKDFLWGEFSGELLRGSIIGFPEYYKKYLFERTQQGET